MIKAEQILREISWPHGGKRALTLAAGEASCSTGDSLTMVRNS
jgi:hypothetical protein